MRRIWQTIVVTIALLLPLTGCWDRREMNELAISVAIGIDKIDQYYQVTVQVVQPGEVAARKGGNGDQTPVTMYQAKGITIFEALRKMTTVSPRKIYAAHLRVAVFGEELAREGIGDALDLLSRDYELRPDFYLLIAKDATAANALNILTPLEKIPANKLFDSIITSEKVWAPVLAVTLDAFITDYVSNGKNPVVSGIKVSGDSMNGKTTGNLETIKPHAQIKNTGLAVFRKDRLIGWLNEEQSKAYNYVLNNVKSTVGHIECPQGGHIALQIMSSKAKITGTVNEGRPRLTVAMDLVENIGEIQCSIDMSQDGAMQDLEERSAQALKDILERSVHAAQNKLKTDFYGFGNAIHRSNPSAWKALQENWDKHFEDAVVDIRVKVKIRSTGTVKNSFLEERE